MKDISFKFVDYKLTKLHYGLRTLAEDVNEDSLINPVFNGHYRLDEDQRISVFLSVKIEAPQLPFIMDVEIAGWFELNKVHLAENKLDKLVTINLNAVLFPFLRETVAECTRRAGFSPLLLPSVNFVKIYEDKIGKKVVEQTL